MALNVNSKTFLMYMAIEEQKKIPMHFKKQVQVKALLFDEAFTEILAEYSDYSNVFSVENAAELLKNTEMNKHAIKLENNK